MPGTSNASAQLAGIGLFCNPVGSVLIVAIVFVSWRGSGSMHSPQFRNVRIWNGLDQQYCEADCISVIDDSIASIGSSEEATGRDTINLSGLTVLPGLIDAHIHLCLDPEVRAAEGQASRSRDDLVGVMAERAEAMVRAGITTARDLGGGRWLELEIRDRINAGALAGPRLLCSGQPVTSIRGHCHFWGGEAKGKEEAIKVIERQVRHKVDLIKVMATGGNLTAGTNPSQAQFDVETLTVIVEEAARHGHRVAAHCHGTPGIRNAIEAGVATIEHCSWVGPDGWGKQYDEVTARLIAEKGIWVSPTVNAGWKRRYGREDFEGAVRGNFLRMKAAGVSLIASTDAGIPNVFHHHLPLALPVFAYFADLNPLETLKSATSDGATGIGLEAVTGSLAEGLSADLLFVEGDPLSDLDVLAKPVAVMARGKMMLDFPG